MSSGMRFLDIPWKTTLAETEKIFSEKNYSLRRKQRYENATFANVGEPLQFVDVPATYFTMYYSFVENEDGRLNSDEDKVFLFCVKGGFDTPMVDQLKQNIEEFYQLSDKDLVKEKDGTWEWTLGTVVLELNIWSDHKASMEMRDLDAESMRNKMIR